LTRPFSVFVIQSQTCTATTGGIDQASTRPAVSRTRTTELTFVRSSAIRVPTPIVRATLATVKTIVRTRTSQKT
jgi:hypothetical protein